MCSIEAYDILHPTSNYNISSDGGRPLKIESTIYMLTSRGHRLKFIDSWLK